MRLHLSAFAAAAIYLAAGTTAQSSIIWVDESNFLAGSGLITFSEFSLGSENPTYSPTDYGGAPTSPTVSLDGLFLGQSLSRNPTVDCPGFAIDSLRFGLAGQVDVPSVPEPATATILLLGPAGLGVATRRNRRP